MRLGSRLVLVEFPRSRPCFLHENDNRFVFEMQWTINERENYVAAEWLFLLRIPISFPELHVAPFLAGFETKCLCIYANEKSCGDCLPKSTGLRELLF